MNRRYFLATAVGAAASRPAVSANDTVGLGFIGLGGRGRSLLGSLAKTPGVRATHLCEVDQANLERAAKLAPGGPPPKTSADLRRLLDDKDVDAVVVATPDHWHAPAALLAIGAGKDVYVEKPASHNLREGRLLLDAARRRGRVVQVGTQSRSRPSTIRAVELCRTGAIGRVLAAKAWNVQLRRNIGKEQDAPVPPGVDYDTWVGPAPMIPFRANRFHYNWHWHWNFGTGDMGNDGAHQLDIARWALDVGMPRRAAGSAQKLFFDDDQQTPDTMNISFEFGDKLLIWEMRIWNPYGLEEIDNGVAVYGTAGMMHIGRWNREWGYKIFDPKGKLAEHFHQPEEGSHLADFAACVRSRQRPHADIEIGHLSGALCHLGNIVARTGSHLDFDARTESITNHPASHALIRRQYRPHWGTPQGV